MNISTCDDDKLLLLVLPIAKIKCLFVFKVITQNRAAINHMKLYTYLDEICFYSMKLTHTQKFFDFGWKLFLYQQFQISF